MAFILHSSYPNGGFFEIASEVGKDVRDVNCQRIQHEINLLRTELMVPMNCR